MPRPGGEADKLGNRYEGLWVVDAALDLIDGEYVDLLVEAIGDEAAGVEFLGTTSSGTREYHSIKRQQAGWQLDDQPSGAREATVRQKHTGRPRTEGPKKVRWESSVQEPVLLN